MSRPAPIRRAVRNEYCIFTHAAAVNDSLYTVWQSVLLHDLQSSVLFESRMPAASEFRLARIAGTTQRSSTSVMAPTRPSHSTRRHSRGSTSSPGFLVNGVPAANPSGRTYAEEMANFAKWYAFNRTRILTMKTAGGIAFSALSEDNARVGFHTLWENNSATAGFLNIKPFDADAQSRLVQQLLRGDAGGETPLPDAVYRIGEYFSNSGNSGLPGATDPLDPGHWQDARSNYHLLSTDGYWNYRLGESATRRSRRQTRTARFRPCRTARQHGLHARSPFPRPYYEGPTATSNSLADLAMKYWINDIRPTTSTTR